MIKYNLNEFYVCFWGASASTNAYLHQPRQSLKKKFRTEEDSGRTMAPRYPCRPSQSPTLEGWGKRNLQSTWKNREGKRKRPNNGDETSLLSTSTAVLCTRYVQHCAISSALLVQQFIASLLALPWWPCSDPVIHHGHKPSRGRSTRVAPSRVSVGGCALKRGTVYAPTSGSF